MTYTVLEYFKDISDNCHEYSSGDTYPRDGHSVSEDRLAELSSDRNARKRPVIAAVADEKQAESENITPAEKPKAKRSRKKV